MTFYEISTPSGSTRSPVFTFVMYILMLIQSTQIVKTSAGLMLTLSKFSMICLQKNAKMLKLHSKIKSEFSNFKLKLKFKFFTSNFACNFVLLILCKLDLCICAHLSSPDCIRQKDGGNNVDVESRICSNSTAHVRSRMTASCLYLTLNNFCNVSSVPIQDSSVKQLCLKDAKDLLAVILPFPNQSYSKRSILSEVSFMTQF